ncbi:hypothetical protein AB7170_22075, partial [Escherichia coli]
EKRVFLVILFTSFSGSLVSRIPGAVQDGYMVGDHRCAILMLLDKAGNQLWDVPVHRMKM